MNERPLRDSSSNFSLSSYKDSTGITEYHLKDVLKAGNEDTAAVETVLSPQQAETVSHVVEIPRSFFGNSLVEDEGDSFIDKPLF